MSGSGVLEDPLEATVCSIHLAHWCCIVGVVVGGAVCVVVVVVRCCVVAVVWCCVVGVALNINKLTTVKPQQEQHNEPSDK
jgi:hypothetical protein